MTDRPLDELINDAESALPLVREWIGGATNPVELLEPALAGDETLLALQVTTRSPTGALAFHTGGLLVDHGWIRVLGGGHERLPRTLATWNGLNGDAHRFPGAVLIADDVVGGFFALNGDALSGPHANVFYFAPDSLEWEDLGIGYTDWISWLCIGDVAGFYQDLRWPGWQEEVASIGADQALSIYPFLWTKGEPVGERSRRPIPIEEVWGLNTEEFPRQLAEIAET